MCQHAWRNFNIITLLSFMAALAFVTIPAMADDTPIKIFKDHARIIQLDQPVSKVIIGNSEIADVSVADASTLVLTGLTFGTTNLVVLDPQGAPLIDEEILVATDEINTVSVFRQTQRSILSCSPLCEVHSVRNADLNP